MNLLTDGPEKCADIIVSRMKISPHSKMVTVDTDGETRFKDWRGQGEVPENCIGIYSRKVATSELTEDLRFALKTFVLRVKE